MTAALALAVVVDVTVALTAGLLIACVLRRRPAALRHWVLAASLAVAASAPLLEVTLPRLELPVLGGAASVTTSGAAFSDLAPTSAPGVRQATDAPRFGWLAAAVAVWAIGCGALLTSLLAGLARLTWMTRRCRTVRSDLWRERAAALSAQCGLHRPVVVVESPDRALLLTWGLIRSRIIVPATAASWSAERIDVVLAHELAHIMRRDWAVQVAAETLRAVHWFNPLMWIACRRLRVDSEHACDDVVLRRGVDAAEYASHLLAVARHVVTAGGGWASAPAVAHVSTLERRIAAMLDVSSNREPVSRAARLVALLVSLALTVPVAATTLTERIVETPFVSGARQDIALEAEASRAALTSSSQTAPDVPIVDMPAARRAGSPAAAAAPALVPVQQSTASLSGTVRDPFGGVMPGVFVAVTNNESGASVNTVTDSGGRYVFRTLVPGQYQFVARLDGFRTASDMMDLAPGQDLRHDRVLPIGQLTEVVTVQCAPAVAARLRFRDSAMLSGARRLTVPRLFPPLRDVGVSIPALAAQVVPVRVGGNLMAPRQIKKVAPVCPAVAPGAGLIVILEATVGADGLVTDLKVLRPTPADDKQTGYVQAAVDAVRQWEYTPTRLNNVPTPVIMTVTVTFTVTPSPR